jgi:hypothetical protein
MLQEKFKKKILFFNFFSEFFFKFGDNTMLADLPNFKCFKKNLRKKERNFYFFIFLEILFQIWRAYNQAVDANGFAVGLAKLEDIESFSK